MGRQGGDPRGTLLVCSLPEGVSLTLFQPLVCGEEQAPGQSCRHKTPNGRDMLPPQLTALVRHLNPNVLTTV